MSIGQAEYKKLLKDAQATCILKNDMPSRLLKAVILHYGSSGEEAVLMELMLALSPPDTNQQVKMRVAALVVEQLCKLLNE